MRGRRAALCATTLTLALLSGGVAAASDSPVDFEDAASRSVDDLSGTAAGAELQADGGAELQAALSGEAATALTLINQWRVANGRQPLRVDPALTTMAQTWATSRVTAQSTTNDPNLGTAAKPLPGYPISLFQYVIGGPGTWTATEMVESAKRSPENPLLDADVNHVGVGWSISGSYRVLYLIQVEYDFNDIGPSDTFYEDVTFLYEAGITTGYPDGSFRPTGAVSREAMAAFLYRALESDTIPACTGTTRKFTDVAAGNPFCGAIEWLEGTGITTGYPDGGFHPGENVSREAMGAFLYRAFESPTIPACAAGERRFTDVNAGHPFCGAIEWLATAGITTGWPDRTFRPGLSVERQAMAAFLYRAA